jgi:hypothetical protein
MAVRAQFRRGGGLPRLPAGGEGGCGAHTHMKMKGGGGRRGQWRRQPMVFKGRCSDMGRGGDRLGGCRVEERKGCGAGTTRPEGGKGGLASGRTRARRRRVEWRAGGVWTGKAGGADWWGMA